MGRPISHTLMRKVHSLVCGRCINDDHGLRGFVHDTGGRPNKVDSAGRSGNSEKNRQTKSRVSFERISRLLVACSNSHRSLDGSVRAFLPDRRAGTRRFFLLQV